MPIVQFIQNTNTCMNNNHHRPIIYSLLFCVCNNYPYFKFNRVYINKYTKKTLGFSGEKENNSKKKTAVTLTMTFF